MDVKTTDNDVIKESAANDAVTIEQIVNAVAQIESANNPEIKLGDNGRALGRYQVHPDWLWDWAKKFKLSPALSETWDSFVARVVWEFISWHMAQLLSPVEIVMYFHIGHLILIGGEGWDYEYEQKFDAAIKKPLGK